MNQDTREELQIAAVGGLVPGAIVYFVARSPVAAVAVGVAGWLALRHVINNLFTSSSPT